MGLRIPEDIQILAYDGTILASAAIPQITYIRQPFEELAEKTVDSMLKLIHGDKVEKNLILDDLTVVYGETTRYRLPTGDE